MSEQIKLRRCREHEDCQLQSTDGGPFEHTPQDRPLVDRFKVLPGWEQEIHERVTKNLLKTDNQRAWLDEAEGRARSFERFRSRFPSKDPEIQRLRDELDNALSQVRDLLVTLQERAARTDALMEALEKREDQLDAIPEVLRTAAALPTAFRDEVDDIQGRLGRLARDVAHEREERLAATRKSITTQRELAARIQDLTDKGRAK